MKAPTPVSISADPNVSALTNRRGKTAKSTAKIPMQVDIISAARYSLTKSGRSFKVDNFATDLSLLDADNENRFRPADLHHAVDNMVMEQRVRQGAH